MAEGQLGEIEQIYLTLGDVLELHALIIDATPAEAANQLRNQPGLESALARPETYAHYQAADLALQATVLAHGIAEGQQFIDGNKRTALIAMLTFWRSMAGVSRHRTPSLRIGYSALAPARHRRPWPSS